LQHAVTQNKVGLLIADAPTNSWGERLTGDVVGIV